MYLLSFIVSDCPVSIEIIGNGFCNDEANDVGCNFDNGDCCGTCVNVDVNVLVLNLEMEYQMHLLQMMKQIPLTVGLMDLIVVDKLSLRITALNVLVLIVSILFLF